MKSLRIFFVWDLGLMVYNFIFFETSVPQ